MKKIGQFRARCFDTCVSVVEESEFARIIKQHFKGERRDGVQSFKEGLCCKSSDSDFFLFRLYRLDTAL